MRFPSARLTVPLFMLTISLPWNFVEASEIRDKAGMFSPAAVRQAESELNRLEKQTKLGVVIETIDDMPNPPESKQARSKAFNTYAESRFAEHGIKGMFILLSKNDHLISNTLIEGHLVSRLPESSRDAIRQAFISEFKNKDFDGGLKLAVQTIEKQVGDRPVTATGGVARRPNMAPAPPMNAPRANGGGFGMSTILFVGLGIFAVFLVLRLLGGLLGAMSGGGGGMRGPGYGPGQQGGPGYGGGGGGGGGFMSSLFGGIGGAMAGNWIYDQFRGNHGNSGNSADGSGGMFGGGSEPTSYDQGGSQIAGGNDNGGEAGSWGEPDAGGGGGGDWGGGGGDWGGGGGDGGGGGGDW